MSLHRPARHKNKNILVASVIVAGCILFGLAAYFRGVPSDPEYQNLTPPKAVRSPAQSASPTVLPIQSRTNIISTRRSSPDGSYSVSQTDLADYSTIAVRDKSGVIVVDDLVAMNSRQIGMNKKFRCQCAVSFVGWTTSRAFVILISNGLGEQFEYTVDARTGLVNEVTFKRVK